MDNQTELGHYWALQFDLLNVRVSTPNAVPEYYPNMYKSGAKPYGTK